jgi:hypothetical protein
VRVVEIVQGQKSRVAEFVQGQESRVAEFGRAMKTAVYEIGWIQGPSRIHTKNKRYMKLEIVESACTKSNDILAAFLSNQHYFCYTSTKRRRAYGKTRAIN